MKKVTVFTAAPFKGTPRIFETAALALAARMIKTGPTLIYGSGPCCLKNWEVIRR